MIPDEHKKDVIQSGINFMRSITVAYGTDEGLKLWDTIADSIDPDIKGKIFFAMLTGEYNTSVTISQYKPDANRVYMVKAIRMVDSRRLDLKKAKNLVDELVTGKTIKVEIDPAMRNSSLSELRDAGFFV